MGALSAITTTAVYGAVDFKFCTVRREHDGRKCAVHEGLELTVKLVARREAGRVGLHGKGGGRLVAMDIS